MANQTRGTGWLVGAVVFGLIAILVLAFGSYSIWHTNNNVHFHRDIVQRRTQELAKLQPVLHIPGNDAKAGQLTQMIDSDRRHVYEYESTRDLAFLITGSCLLPGIIAVVFLCVYFGKRAHTANAGLDS